MTDDLAALREEIERLRDLCDENGIDPDPRDVDAATPDWATLAAAPDFMTLAPCEFTKAAATLLSSTNAFFRNLTAQYDGQYAPEAESPDYLSIARDLNNT